MHHTAGNLFFGHESILMILLFGGKTLVASRRRDYARFLYQAALAPMVLGADGR
jgi:hypothetical protein